MQPEILFLKKAPINGFWHVLAAYGDPHFLTWEGTRFDFHGQGDYYLVRARRQVRRRVCFFFLLFFSSSFSPAGSQSYTHLLRKVLISQSVPPDKP
jgi:hypothetical protein